MIKTEPLKNQDISKKLMILPKYINDKKYIHDKIYEKEKKCNIEGYIEKIYKINTISFNKFYEQNFSGSILINVNFNADIINVEIGDIIECKVMKANEDGIVAQGLYPIFVIIDGDYEQLSFINIDDIINVKIVKKEISINRNIIKAVGKYIDKDIIVNLDNNEENEQKDIDS